VRSSDRQAGSGPLIRVSFVCTANRARSPFAAALLRRSTAELPVAVDSYGTLDRADAPALPQAIRAAREFGIDLTSHRARSATTAVFADSDLVVGFEQFHIAHAVVTAGAIRERVFLLTELAAACAQLDILPRDEESFRAAVASADEIRSTAGRIPEAIGDPVGRSDRRFVETYDLIERMTGVIAARLFGVS
jgi:protein-tyrosine-phosphatase